MSQTMFTACVCVCEPCTQVTEANPPQGYGHLQQAIIMAKKTLKHSNIFTYQYMDDMHVSLAIFSFAEPGATV
jgi:hypothetical protein